MLLKFLRVPHTQGLSVWGLCDGLPDSAPLAPLGEVP